MPGVDTDLFDVGLDTADADPLERPYLAHTDQGVGMTEPTETTPTTEGAVTPSPVPRPAPAASPIPTSGQRVVRQQGAWGLWWLVVVTLGVYYYVWYHRINHELALVTGEDPTKADCQWWSQLIPIFNFVSLYQTAKRLNRAHEAVDSPARVSPFVAWFWAPSWFASQTRYLQRRINTLHDVQVSQHRRFGA